VAELVQEDEQGKAEDDHEPGHRREKRLSRSVSATLTTIDKPSGK
jgi:hypothetical protein